MKGTVAFNDHDTVRLTAPLYGYLIGSFGVIVMTFDDGAHMVEIDGATGLDGLVTARADQIELCEPRA